MPSPAPPLSCGGQLAADTCAGGSEELSFQFSIEGLAVDASGVTTTVTAGQPIEVRSLAFGSGMLPVQARESVSLDAYVSGASLLLTQASANVGSSSLFFKPETGSVSFAVSEQPPPGYVFAVEAFQAVDCSPEDAWQSSVNNTFGTCTWLHASLGRYARYDPLTSSASAAYHSASDWGSLFVLHLSPVQDWVVPFSVTIVDPTNATDIEGSAGGPEVGGVFRFSASVNGTENVTATAAYYPGEAHPMNARVGSSNGRALLATAEPDYVTTTVASAMLHLSQGGNVYAPINGSFSFSDVSSKSGDRFFVRAFSYSDCDPADISKLSTFVNCTWQEVADQSVTLSIDAANQRATLGNLGGTWNTLHVLSRVSVATRPRAPPAGGDVAGAAVGMGAQAILIVLAVVAGLFLVIGLPLVAMHRGALMGALSRRRERPVRGDGHSA